jgi:uncharacterized protein YggE
MKKLLHATAYFLTFSAFMTVATNGFAQMPPPSPMPHVINVTGEAKEEVAPDQAILSVSLVSKDKNLNEAKKQNDAQVAKLVSIARDFEIPKDKLATSNVYIAPEYEYGKNAGKRDFIGYVVSRSVRITMDNIAIHERVLSAIVDANIDQVNGVEFALKDTQPRKDALRAKAFANARAKAEALAQAAGMKLGKPVHIAESDSQMPGYPRPMMMAKSGAADSSVAPSLPGLVTVRVDVDVAFAVE